jgi:hypothetical protein
MSQTVVVAAAAAVFIAGLCGKVPLVLWLFLLAAAIGYAAANGQLP